MKKILISLGVLVLTLTACSFADNQSNFAEEEDYTIAEALLPSDIFFLVKLDTQDEEEYNNFNALISDNFFIEGFKDGFVESRNKALEQMDLSYSEDIQPLLGERTETLLALGGDLTNRVPDFYLIQSLEDLTKYTKIVDKLAVNQIVTAIPNGYKSGELSSEEIFFGNRNDYLVLTNDQDAFTEMMTINATDSLVYAENYVKMRGNLPSSFFALAYFNLDLLLDEAQNIVESQEDQTLAEAFNTPLANLIQSVGGSLHLEEDGMKFLAYAQGNETVMQEVDFKFNEIPNQKTYLADLLPGKGIFAYTEVFNLKQKIEDIEEKFEKNSTEAFTQYETQKQQLKAVIGLDLDQDVLTWLDRATAISLQNLENLLPGLTFAFDVKSNPEGAAKLVETLDSFLSIAMLSLQDYAEVIQKEEVELDDVTFKQLSILPENLPLEIQEQGDLIVQILSDLKIIYGITKENVMIFTTYPDFIESYSEETVSKNSAYKKVSDKIETKGQGVFFVSPETLVAYLDQLFEENQDLFIMSATDRANFQILRDFLKPFKGLILTTIAHDDSVEAQGYLQLGQ